MKAAVVVTLVCGIVLFVLSSLWTTLFSSASKWTPEKAKRSSEIQNRLNNLGPLVNPPTPNMQRGADPATYKAEFEALKKENEELNAEFTSAAATPQTVSKFLKWSGLTLAIVGLIGWYAVGQQR